LFDCSIERGSGIVRTSVRALAMNIAVTGWPQAAWLFVILGLACGSDSPLESDPVPVGPPPAISLSSGFDDAPVEGFVRLQPDSSAGSWKYYVDLDEDGAWNHQGTLDRDLSYAYRFDSPGAHTVRVRLEGAADTVDAEHAVVVNDPTGIAVTATAFVGRPDHSGGFEGITTSPDGADVFVGAFDDGVVYRIDRAALEVRDSIALGHGVEGLSVSPSGEFLFVAHKRPIAAFRLKLPDMQPTSPSEGPPTDNFFAHALDDQRALFGGEAPLVVYDARLERIVARALGPDGQELPNSGHFAVAPDGATVVTADPWGAGTLRVLTLPDLRSQAEWSLSEGTWIHAVAFSPDGKRLFVAGGARLYVLDARTGTIEKDFGLGVLGGFANPVARSRDGRFLAFEGHDGVVIVEIERAIPLYRIPGHSSVATDPIVDAGFVLLDIIGGLRTITIRP
jgi:DNA-binding beta-propeller fold protein YncE